MWKNIQDCKVKNLHLIKMCCTVNSILLLHDKYVCMYCISLMSHESDVQLLDCASL